MNPLFVCLRNLLLITVASWGVVDSLVSYASNVPDPDAETEAYAPLETKISRKQLAPERSSSARIDRLVDRSPAVHINRAAASAAAFHTGRAGSDRLYTLMSLRR